MKEFDLDELSEFDGKDGKPVYVAHKGKVFDVTESKLWKGGLHMRRHRAAQDLTTDFQAAPHGTDVLERYPQVGVIKKKEIPEKRIPEVLSGLLDRFPMLKRHPHPMTVHFPIVFMFATTVFTILYVLTGIKSLEVTAAYCLGAGLLFTPVVVLTGLFSWWLNYMARPIKPILIKVWCSIFLWILTVIAFNWRLADPAILDSFTVEGFVYFLIILALAPLVTVIGWFGAKMTFPVERE